jgi:hypothetical protein
MCVFLDVVIVNACLYRFSRMLVQDIRQELDMLRTAVCELQQDVILVKVRALTHWLLCFATASSFSSRSLPRVDGPLQAECGDLRQLIQVRLSFFVLLFVGVF